VLGLVDMRMWLQASNCQSCVGHMFASTSAGRMYSPSSHMTVLSHGQRKSSSLARHRMSVVMTCRCCTACMQCRAVHITTCIVTSAAVSYLSMHGTQ
jgi:hypothetical protein